MQGPLVYLAACVFMVRRTFDLAQLKNKEMKLENPFYTMPLGYMNALIASVTGDEESSKLAKEYLADVDPDTWSD